MVALEAMSCAMPVVVSKVGALPSFVTDGKNGFLFDSGDTTTLQKTLLHILQGKVDVKRIGEEARMRACTNFSWEEKTASYVEIFQKLLKSVIYEK